MVVTQDAACPLFEVEYSFTLDEWREAVLFALRNERRSNLWLVAAAIVMVASGLSPLLDGRDASEARTSIGVVAFAYAMLQLIAPRWRLRRSWHGYMKDERMVVCLTIQSYTVTDSDERNEISWHAFTHFSETPRLFMIHQRTGLVRAIPKRAIGDQTRIDELRTILLDRIGRTSEMASRGFPVNPASGSGDADANRRV